jgi:hypothetical protein
MRRLAMIAVALFVLPVAATACTQDDRDEARDTAEDVQDDVAEGIDTVGARSVAETFRLSMQNNDTAEREGMRSIDALEQARDDLPGDPEITGIEDTTGDGMDDDGEVEVTVGGETACVTLPEEGDDIEVTDGSC